MLKEKYKIRITKRLKKILTDDMELFNFVKPSKSLNQNKFYSVILKGMIIHYKNQVDTIEDTLKSEMSICDKNHIRKLANRIYTNILKSQYSDFDSNHQYDIYIQTTKDNSSTIRYIEDNLLQEETFSEFVRYLFNEYTNLPLSLRMMIAKRDIINDITSAIKESKELIIITTENTELILRPYLVCYNDEVVDLFILGEYIENNQSHIGGYNLSLMSSSMVSGTYFKLDKNILDYLNKEYQ